MKDSDIKKAGEVSDFMLSLSRNQSERWENAGQEIPYGDLAYGSALCHWIEKGRSASSFFSYAKGQVPCPFLMEFRKEISAEFGLPILTIQEGIERERSQAVIRHKVVDWGLN